MTNVIPDAYKVSALKGAIAPLTDTIQCALFNTALVPAQSGQVFMSDIISHEISGAGYTTLGVVLASKTITEDDVNNRGVFDAADAVWAALTAANIAFAVIFKNTGSNATSPILAILDLGGAQSQTGAQFTVQFDAAGIMYLG